MKRVAVYYPWIHLRGGAERVMLEIARRSCHRVTLFTHHLDLAQTFPEFRTLSALTVLGGVSVQRSFAGVLKACASIAREKLDLRGFDALLITTDGVGEFLTLRNHAIPVLCFCHTPVRPVYDPVYRRVWLHGRPAARLPLAVFSFFYRWLTRLAWKHFRRVFVNGEEVRRRIAAGRICALEKVEVLHPGVDLAGISPEFAHDRYFLYAGRIKWTKNVELAIDAFHAFRAAQGDSGWRLIVAGAVDPSSGDYVMALRQRAGDLGAVEFVENPSDAELNTLYTRCYALVFPSLNEDWGLVPLEAMARAKPVLAVNRGGPTESIVHEETGFLLAPTPEAFATKMTWLVEHPEAAKRMGALAVDRVRRYSWEAFVQRLDDYLERSC